MIVCWRITDAAGGPFRLRVLTPDGVTTYTGAGTSAQRRPGADDQSFATNLPIKAGQAIGVDDSGADQIGYKLDEGTHLAWTGSLANGSKRASTTPPVAGEFGLNADVQTSGANQGCGGGGGGGGGHGGHPHCVVPKLTGETLKTAKKRLKAADCRLGKVTGHGRKVKKQKPKAGKVLPSGSKVSVKLG